MTHRTLIAVPVYNRLKVSQLCLASLYQNRKGAVVHVYNDHSTEYSSDALAGYCDEIFLLPPSKKVVVQMESNRDGMGVQNLRWYQFRDFLKRPEFDLLYLTDSDALHDPCFMEVFASLLSIMEKSGQVLPLCLYNSSFHNNNDNNAGRTKRLLLRKTAPGISQLYTRSMVEKIVFELDKFGTDPDYNWDYHAPNALGLPILTTDDSYIEHFGAVAGSMHTTAGDWDRDRALNPTPYLRSRRQDIINFLMGVLPSPPSL